MKVTVAEHERIEALARKHGMTLSDLLRTALARFEVDRGPESWQAEDETHALLDAPLGPPEVRRIYEDVRAAFLVDSVERETQEDAQRRFEDWLTGS